MQKWMYNISKYYFFRCYHCGEWFYSSHKIKIKKCSKCNRTFQFSKSIKFSKLCTLEVAVATIKHLKRSNQQVERPLQPLNLKRWIKRWSQQRLVPKL
jgi:hypothetical protein